MRFGSYLFIVMIVTKSIYFSRVIKPPSIYVYANRVCYKTTQLNEKLSESITNQSVLLSY